MSPEKLTGSESVIDVPMSTARLKGCAAAALIAIGEQRVQAARKAAPQRTLRLVHAGDERAVSSPSAEPYETTRCKGDNPARTSWRSQRARWRRSTSGSDAA